MAMIGFPYCDAKGWLVGFGARPAASLLSGNEKEPPPRLALFCFPMVHHLSPSPSRGSILDFSGFFYLVTRSRFSFVHWQSNERLVGDNTDRERMEDKKSVAGGRKDPVFGRGCHLAGWPLIRCRIQRTNDMSKMKTTTTITAKQLLIEGG